MEEKVRKNEMAVLIGEKLLGILAECSGRSNACAFRLVHLEKRDEEKTNRLLCSFAHLARSFVPHFLFPSKGNQQQKSGSHAFSKRKKPLQELEGCGSMVFTAAWISGARRKHCGR